MRPRSSLTVESGGEAPRANHAAPIRALPGRPKRRRANGAISASERRRRRGRGSSLSSLLSQLILKFKGGKNGSGVGGAGAAVPAAAGAGPSSAFTASLWLAIGLWYSLGVLSIATSKIILSRHSVSPLVLTLQQLLVGSTLLRMLLHIQGNKSSSSRSNGFLVEFLLVVSRSSNNNKNTNGGTRELFLAATCFTAGFLATNYGFSGSAASFVETVKAAEPLTSATVAAAYGIEVITAPQKASLGTIIAGVLLSTLGHGGGGGGSSGSTSAQQQSLSSSLVAGTIVMTSNLCFSFRGLYQKLFRKHCPKEALDDLSLQYRMQWTGVLLMICPVILFEVLPAVWHGNLYWSTAMTATAKAMEQQQQQHNHSTSLPSYLLLALANGCAFTSYNLASTYILSRISVVHHAALNCIRRVFAICVTSVLFGVPITAAGAVGITLAVAGFMAYTHFKVQAQQQQRQKQGGPASLLPVSTS